MKINNISTRQVDPCGDNCLPQLDQVQMGEIYDLLDVRIRTSLQEDYDCKKINGPTFVDTWAKMMGPTLNGILQSMVAIATKETAADRCVKTAQCAKLSAETTEIGARSTREDGLAAATNTLKGHQGDLYIRQAKGFDDNAFQKLFDSQLNSWSMVFADTDLAQVSPPLQDVHICDSFNRIKVGMGEASGTCEATPPPEATVSKKKKSSVQTLNEKNTKTTK